MSRTKAATQRRLETTFNPLMGKAKGGTKVHIIANDLGSIDKEPYDLAHCGREVEFDSSYDIEYVPPGQLCKQCDKAVNYERVYR